MKKQILILMASTCLALVGCSKDNGNKTLKVGTSADYPPFEYVENGQIKGFDIDLANLVAEQMGKTAEFHDMQFSTILPEIQSDYVDIGVSTMTDTKEREKVFDFSTNYYMETMAIVYKTDKPITTEAQFEGKKIACQLGTTMQFWLEKHAKKSNIVRMDNSNQEIEDLKAGYVDGVFIDQVQASAFCQKNKGLGYSVISKSDSGYAIVMKKGSPLKEQIDKSIAVLQKNGRLNQLEQKWFNENKLK